MIGVDTGSRDTLAMREAMRHVQEGGVCIFPKAGLSARAQHHALPARRRTDHLKPARASVLPILIDGTPQVEPAWASLWRFGNARIRVFPRIDYSKSGLSASEIVADPANATSNGPAGRSTPIAARPGRPSHEAAAPREPIALVPTPPLSRQSHRPARQANRPHKLSEIRGALRTHLILEPASDPPCRARIHKQRRPDAHARRACEHELGGILPVHHPAQNR